MGQGIPPNLIIYVAYLAAVGTIFNVFNYDAVLKNTKVNANIGCQEQNEGLTALVDAVKLETDDLLLELQG